MRLFVGLLLLLLTCSCSNKNSEEKTVIAPITKDDILPGITLEQLHTVYPGSVPNQLGQIEIEDTLYGLKGTWTYAFTGSTLTWAVFDASYTTINEETFYLCKNAAEQILSQFQASYDSPENLERGIQVFRDPSKQPHWGYPVLAAEWVYKGMKRSLRFIFQGGKGERYQLRVSIEIKKQV